MTALKQYQKEAQNYKSFYSDNSFFVKFFIYIYDYSQAD